MKAIRQVILFTAGKDIKTYFPETRKMSSDIDRDKYFIRALNLHLKKMQESGQTIVSVAYTSGAYAEKTALICYE